MAVVKELRLGELEVNDVARITLPWDSQLQIVARVKDHLGEHNSVTVIREIAEDGHEVPLSILILGTTKAV